MRLLIVNLSLESLVGDDLERAFSELEVACNVGCIQRPVLSLKWHHAIQLIADP